MHPYEESLLEEREAQYDQLITLLRRAYHQEQTLSEREQQEAIRRVGVRLTRWTEPSTAAAERTPKKASEASLFGALSRSTHHRPMRRTLNTLAALLVVGVLIGSALLLFIQRGQQMHRLVLPTGTPGLAGPVGTPVTTQVDWAGLKMSMQVTPGPYFLGELLAVDLTLTNQTHPTLTLAGWVSPRSACRSPLGVEQTGGTSPSYTPFTMPVALILHCPAIGPFGEALPPGATVSAHVDLLLTKTGKVTVTGLAWFLLSTTSADSGPGPLGGHLPTLSLSVTTQLPPDRMLQLQQGQFEVIIGAPIGLQLLDQTYVICQDAANHPWASGTGHNYWEPLFPPVLHPPACGGSNQTLKLWKYAVGAEGYEVVQGEQGQYTGPPFPESAL